MNTENLHKLLSPDAYARLREDLKRQAQREHREAIQSFGFAGLRASEAQARRTVSHPLACLSPQKA